MEHELSLAEIKKEWHGSLTAYLIGFFTSIILTSLSFLLVYAKWLHGPTLTVTIIGLALVQAVIQLLFFLHLGQETKPKWETLIFCFMLLLLLIVVLGTLWVMYDLNHRVMLDMNMEMPHD